VLSRVWTHRVYRLAAVALAALACAAALFTVASARGGSAPGSNVGLSGPDSPATVWAVGDGADGGQPAKQVVELIQSAKPSRVLYLGDVYEAGTALEYASNYSSTYGPLSRITAPTPGNHEWPNRSEGYDSYWEVAMGHAIPPYYEFRLAGWKFLSLNSEAPHDERSAQMRWLRSRLQTPGDCRIAFWHRPRFSQGEHGDAGDMAPVWDALRGHAVLVLSGHDHAMERYQPIDGITELIAGAGGHGLYAVGEGDPRLRFANDDTYGALRLDLRPALAQYAFVSLRGRTLDRGDVRCSKALRSAQRP
jgi:calcineurin-like phosphoesterase family protein